MSPSELPVASRRGNRLLDLLPSVEYERLLERSDRVRVPIREAVAEPSEPARHAHFPLTSVFSTIFPLRDGSAIEAATVGNEGVTGIDLITERAASVYRVVQQVEGESLRIHADYFRALLAENGPTRRVIDRYLLTLLHQSGQSAACNIRHDVEERMCRWLLMTHDRVGADEFYLTQEFLSIMLGVRRQSVSLTAALLQEAGFLTYSRGHVKILNRAGLEQSSCECYFTIRDTYERVMEVAEH